MSEGRAHASQSVLNLETGSKGLGVRSVQTDTKEDSGEKGSPRNDLKGRK